MIFNFFIILMIIAAVAQSANSFQGFPCPKTNYRIFPLHSNIKEAWYGRNSDARTMCRLSGHILTQNLRCVQTFFELNDTELTKYFASLPLPQLFWVGGNHTGCLSWARSNNVSVTISCDHFAAAICQGFASDDMTFSEYHAYKTYSFPFTQIFRATPATIPSSSNRTEWDPFYIMCGVLGIVLFLIIISAAIWRSGVVGNKYAYERRPSAEQSFLPPTSAAAGHPSVSEVPRGYVKASVTKETIA